MTKHITCDRCNREVEGMKEVCQGEEVYDLCPEHHKEYDIVYLKSWELSVKDHDRRMLKWLNNQ